MEMRVREVSLLGPDELPELARSADGGDSGNAAAAAKFAVSGVGSINETIAADDGAGDPL
jgi:hypothetical protein